MQERALALMGKKLTAAQALEGRFSSEGLVAMAGEDANVEIALARQRAVEEAAAMVHHHRPMDPALVDAVMRAQAIAQKAQHEAELTALGHQMERFVTDFQAGGGTVDAGSLEHVLTTFGGHVGAAFDTGVTGLLQILGLDKLLGVKRKRKRKKKAKRLGAGGTT